MMREVKREVLEVLTARCHAPMRLSIFLLDLAPHPADEELPDDDKENHRDDNRRSCKCERKHKRLISPTISGIVSKMAHAPA